MAKTTAKYGDYTIAIEESGTVKVTLNGSECKNTKAALRDIAEEAGFTIDEKWNTRQTGKKLAEYLNTNTPKNSTSNLIRVAIEITEHEYAAFDYFDDMLDDTFAFNSDDAPKSICITVDGKEIEFNEEDIYDDYSSYQPFNLADIWDNENIVKFGYFDNIAKKEWEFTAENFDVRKLCFYYKCFDAQFAPANHDQEEHRISLLYDDKEIEEDFDAYSYSEGEFEQLWCLDEDFEDDDEYVEDDDEDNDENGEEDCTDSSDVLASLKKKYDNAWAFDNGLYLIMENDLYGFADKYGNTLVQPQYNDTYDDFVGGMIFVWKNGLGGYVNESGEEVIAPQFKRLGYFENGYTFVSQDMNGKWGVFDINGNQITPLIYDDISSFTDGKAKVKLNGEEFYIDTNGNRIDEEIIKVTKEASVVFLDDDDNHQSRWTIYALEGGAIVVHKDKEEVDNTKSALRYIAEYIGFSYDTNWNTRQFGSKLIDFINEQRAQDNCSTEETDD